METRFRKKSDNRYKKCSYLCIVPQTFDQDCRCSELSQEVADLKLDLASIESKLCERTHTIENNILSMNDHTKEEFSTCGNFTNNVPTTPNECKLLRTVKS